MTIDRPLYLTQLINARHNHKIKVLTGIRRCGKSFLLFDIFTRWLLGQGIDKAHIVHVDLEDRRNKHLYDPDALLQYIDSKLLDDRMHYVMIDEIQHVPEFEDVLNSYLKSGNADVYVTGSNSRFLSQDVITTFRGRGDQIHVYPLTFGEIYNALGGDRRELLDRYMYYGGLPQVVLETDDRKKEADLRQLVQLVYLKDIEERYKIQYPEAMADLLNIVASTIGSLTNPTRLTNTFESIEKTRISRNTVVNYLDYMTEAFLIEKSLRYDVKGRRYMDSQCKYYFSDLGLRNAQIGFRQVEPTHLMENLIYNQLLVWGFNVDVGVVNVSETGSDGQRVRKQREIDFVCNRGSQCYYIQAAYRLADREKLMQETASLRGVGDNFKKIVVTLDQTVVGRDRDGVTYLGLFDFLLRPNPLEL